jgi:hypothetical protein
MMKQRTGVHAICGWSIMLSLLLGTAATGAEAPADNSAAAPSSQQDSTSRRNQELSEVLVQGKRTKPVRNPQLIIDWMRRLVGQFRYQGYVELHDSNGAPRGQQPVTGKGDCVAFGLAPGVQCTIKVNWPEDEVDPGTELLGGVSYLDPAMVLYGLDPDELAVHYLQVDNKGVADGGLGYLLGDTMTTRDPCVGIAGDCTRTTKITARPDGQLVQTQIDIERDGQLAVRYLFVMRPMMRFKEADEP